MSLRKPVKYPVKYYSWQDNQAPQLSNADGVIKTILKACLVTGYGSKAGAGWTSLFEDDYRIVLRRPLRTGTPPDIKIENGTITGETVRHRIVAQDNPASLDDATELSAVSLLALGDTNSEWHCMVTDFAFLFCYRMVCQNAVYCGEVMRVREDDAVYIYNFDISVSGSGRNDNIRVLDSNYRYPAGFLSGNNKHVDMLKGTEYGLQIQSLTGEEKVINNDYFVQKIIIDEFKGIYPFWAAIPTENAVRSTNVVDIDSRKCLRYVTTTRRLWGENNTRALYIPLDYWEL